MWARTSSEARVAIWREWLKMMQSDRESPESSPKYGTENFRMLSFTEVFFESKAIELITESVIR